MAKIGQAGTLESNDLMVMVEILPSSSGICVDLKSDVKVQFGTHIEKVVLEVLKQKGITGAKVQVQDRGALDFTIRARVETALERAMRL